MADIHQRNVEAGTNRQRVRKRRRRRSQDFRKNMIWCVIILIVTLLLGAVIGFYSTYFDRYFSSDEENAAISGQSIPKKLQDLYLEKMLQEKERSKR
jgi:uncharacterized protein YneF (UPF0154 family)